MNWGKGLVLGLAAFMIFITLLVVQMFRTAEDSFDKDYYEKGLAYDVDYQQMQQVIKDKAAPSLRQDDNFVQIDFAKVDSGTVNFKRPSDRKKDQLYSFNEREVRLPKSAFEKGEWRIIIHWTADGKKYLYQSNMFMQ
ncbi:hypothetical protein BCY91_04740 [Pelobium manganitolerans]|uniref:Nitrogen fixation protein FixH n=1 Tax=Pelobium manganitolerans TaxID=1842495 RepID=A0A419S5R5_9SPHI|nr:FixH family protein [Pelobium manganitolerans]RKD16190.1 hypothetical protein BCY91_04740 [Pelobium manganitolerans]